MDTTIETITTGEAQVLLDEIAKKYTSNDTPSAETVLLYALTELAVAKRQAAEQASIAKLRTDNFERMSREYDVLMGDYRRLTQKEQNTAGELREAKQAHATMLTVLKQVTELAVKVANREDCEDY